MVIHVTTETELHLLGDLRANWSVLTKAIWEAISQRSDDWEAGNDWRRAPQKRGGMKMAVGSKSVQSVSVRSPLFPRFRRLNASVQGHLTDVQRHRQWKEEVENKTAGHPSGKIKPFLTSLMFAISLQPKCRRKVRNEQQAEQSWAPLRERKMEMQEKR